MEYKGKVLISEPFLGDPNFERTVILMCEHNDSGSFGFILNKPLMLTLNEVIDGVSDAREKLFIGGPVAQDSLHFIYRNKYNIQDSIQILDNVYWGGNYEQLLDLINNKLINPDDFRFFLGYSGWGEGQLLTEMEQNSWIVSFINSDDIFETTPEELWRVILKNMGGKYKMFSNYPIDPRLN